MVKAAIFDLDGTLANTLADLTTAINATRVYYGLDEVDEKFILKFVNGDTLTFIHECVPDIKDDEAERAVAVYKRTYSKCYLEKTRPYDGIKESLEELKKSGIKLAVFSNKADEYVKMMADEIFGGIFDIALGAGIFPSKPAPDGALDILRRLGISPNEAVYIGDSDVDVETAKNAGIKAIGVSWGYRGRAFLENLGGCAVVDTPDEMVKIIKRGEL